MVKWRKSGTTNTYINSAAIIILKELVSNSLCFRCYQCFSHLSWEDCNKHAIKTDECKPPKVCYMAHRIFQRKGQQRHNFIKACYSPRWCPQERCRQTTQTSVDGSWCETKCCKEKDLCNTGMTPSWERAYVGKESAVNQNVPHKGFNMGNQYLIQ
ncbi:hypothetical protein pdam_00019155 [Pocillopora damicornis]|uniref:UPAR/Ly6 domain-containing protein n=1 Tax=Pocillopora damicornis TaxID=46731 RepID=A0A3M6TSQ8_POCDA|nr:hypothetical protein pdam_00019155 [Pocillopora damicornis]